MPKVHWTIIYRRGHKIITNVKTKVPTYKTGDVIKGRTMNVKVVSYPGQYRPCYLCVFRDNRLKLGGSLNCCRRRNKELRVRIHYWEQVKECCDIIPDGCVFEEVKEGGV